jgi:hypothetical protein
MKQIRNFFEKPSHKFQNPSSKGDIEKEGIESIDVSLMES